MSSGAKVTCSERGCGWHGRVSDLLEAENPFVPGDTLHACPRCKEIGSCYGACDEPDCWQEAICGTPTPNGYRQTCSKHMPA